MTARRLLAAATLITTLAVVAPATADAASYRFGVTATKTTSVKHDGYVVSRGLLTTARGAVGKSRAKVHRGQNPRLSIRSVFSEGTIRARGRFTDEGDALVLPITGGSGAFRHASGALKIVPVTKGTAHWKFVLDSYGRAVAAGRALAASDPPANFKARTKVVRSKIDGDTAIFKEKLKVGGRKAGTSKLKLDYGKGGIKFSGTWRLKGGLIKARDEVRGDPKHPKVRIRRGTGAYKGAEGTVTFKSISDKANLEIFKFK